MTSAPTQREMRSGIRKSRMLLNKVYFWTDTIKDWSMLLDDPFKEMIVNSWQELVKRNKILIHGFIIMPNHLHLIWERVEMNGKEMPHASFNKFTSHQFLENLRLNNQSLLFNFIGLNSNERNPQFWQRDPLAVKLYSRYVMEQKIGVYSFKSPSGKVEFGNTTRGLPLVIS